MVKRFCTDRGRVYGNFSGHSGKVTCTTELYINEVDKQLIQAQTGHRSTSSVRCYKRTQEEHIRKVSRILQQQLRRKKLHADEPNVTTGASLLQSPNPMALLRELFDSGYEPSRSVPGTGTSFSASNMTFNLKSFKSEVTHSVNSFN